MTARQIGAAGAALIKTFESCKLTAYRCPAGVWTIGYGSTGPHVKPGMTISQDKAESLFKEDVARFEARVTKEAPGATQNQFDAMVSFAFNVGEDAFRTSTLLRKHKAGDVAGARAEFARWNKADGKIQKGLIRRRAAEAALYAA
ncbi:glycoside hydrolase family protein [Novosphingobium sp. Rr 2-17]|uniref:lysozyme n=1 Tax=Novosphingobium sp. Rr 2-17 TaxID=555793 RepID=UPI0002698595|nr:lysozyme [Novosphingobium sp. Rr 2-17]EIZ77761.1 glycoside hydrolase family protein [Novosphingobium sp. Rr 2-17]